MSTGVAGYYDRLGAWNRAARIFGYGGGSTSLTVHRALADPKAGGRPTVTRLHDILVERLPRIEHPRVLDAGCGLGGTMLALADALGATCTGLTLSRSQCETANAAAARRGLAAAIRAVVQSYDEPPEGPFDLIVAIESLAHSLDPARSISALVRTLAPGGCIAVVDDMPEPGADGAHDLSTFKAGWQCPVLWSAAAYREALSRAGLTIVADDDLSDECRPRKARTITRLIAMNRAVHLLPWSGLRHVMDSHLGGLALERLLSARLVRYRLLIARRPELRVS